MRVVYWVHHAAANLRSTTLPTIPTSFADFDISGINVTHLADGGVAFFAEHPHFTGGQFQSDKFPFFGLNLSFRSSAPNYLTTSTGGEFYVMDFCTERKIAQWQGIANFQRRFGSSNDWVANFQAIRMKNIPLFSILILKQGYSGIAIRIVFNFCDFGGDIVLVAAKVDRAI
jgi:hypothetical protein